MKGVKTGGREKGTQNKFTRTVKEVFATVFNELQADKVTNLKAWAKNNPTDFYKLATKLIPTELTGNGGEPIKIQTYILPDGTEIEF